jgi:hypothetical protein
MLWLQVFGVFSAQCAISLIFVASIAKLLSVCHRIAGKEVMF